MKVAAFG